MEFEYDPKKSELNREKHGISLEQTKELWAFPGVEVPARTADEPRCLRIGKLGAKFYSCFYTIRGEKIRLISARRSRPEEEAIYEERIKDAEREGKEKNQGE
jgi:uncharacterized DUF497 family protein